MKNFPFDCHPNDEKCKKKNSIRNFSVLVIWYSAHTRITKNEHELSTTIVIAHDGIAKIFSHSFAVEKISFSRKKECKRIKRERKMSMKKARKLRNIFQLVTVFFCV